MGPEAFDRYRTRPCHLTDQSQKLGAVHRQAEDPPDDALNLLDSAQTPRGLLFEQFHQILRRGVDHRVEQCLLGREVVEDRLLAHA